MSMIKPEIFLAANDEGVKAAVCYNGKLWQAIATSLSGAQDSLIGAVYAARVVKRLNKQHALADIGAKQPVFLEATQAEAPEGALLLAQIRRDGWGSKAPTLTTQLQFGGRYTLYQPLEKQIVFPKTKADPVSLRHALEKIQFTGVLRDSAFLAAEQDVMSEAKRQIERHRSLQQDFDSRRAMALLQAAPNSFDRFLADLPACQKIILDNKLFLAEIRDRIAAVAPDLLPVLQIQDQKEPILNVYDIADQWHQGLQSEIILPGGVRLIFEVGQTLTAIDIDHAGAMGDTVALNLSAVEEVARQIVLRNLGGLIVIDFLKMRQVSDRLSVEQAMINALARDPYHPYILGFTKAGLCEITRARRGTALPPLL